MNAFIGIDLAWRSDRNHTGTAVLCGNEQGADLAVTGEPIHSLAGVRAFISRFEEETTIIAIDAPLIIPNDTGQRLCERQVGSRYGRNHASCHASNRRLYPGAASVALADSLVAEGYRHAPDAGDGRRLLLEVYPHAAMVALFGLPRILKYKKGTLAQKRAGLGSLAEHIRRLSSAHPRLDMNDQLRQTLATQLSQLPGSVLKMHEDTLDAIICAYLAYYFWYWKRDRNEIFGNSAVGYIVIPKRVDGVEQFGLSAPAS